MGIENSSQRQSTGKSALKLIKKRSLKLGEGIKSLHRPQPSTEKIPLYLCRVEAGFPSPADDHIEKNINLNQHLVRNPAATFFVRAAGNSMINAGIYEGDILVVDRSLEPHSGKIIIAVLNGELTVKRFHKKGNQITLYPENSEYAPIPITAETDFMVWGIVTSVVHEF